MDKGIKQPTESELRESIKTLSHNELRKTIFLSKPLNNHEINCIRLISYGRGVKEIARVLNLAEISLKNIALALAENCAAKLFTKPFLL